MFESPSGVFWSFSQLLGSRRLPFVPFALAPFQIPLEIIVRIVIHKLHTLCAHVNERRPSLWWCAIRSQTPYRFIQRIWNSVDRDGVVSQHILIEALGDEWAVAILHSPA
jgi:hypothetical protein